MCFVHFGGTFGGEYYDICVKTGVKSKKRSVCHETFEIIAL